MSQRTASGSAEAAANAEEAHPGYPAHPGNPAHPGQPEEPGGDPDTSIVAGPPRFPKRYVYYAAYGTLALLVLLALGAFLISRYGSTSTVSSTPTGSLRAPAAGTPSGTTPPVSSQELKATLAAFMDINPLRGTPASDFTMTDATSRSAVSLSSLSGHVVVLSFANAQCNDICPVLATELHRAASLLGRTKVPVTFVTINTDPLDTKTGSVPIAHQPQLVSLPDWRFLTGTLRQLNAVWKAYGVSVTVDETSRQVSHNDPLYFISPTGKLEWSATVFGDETKHGHFTLPASELARYAKGVAHYADELADRA